jgi:hypothetical protein
LSMWIGLVIMTAGLLGAAFANSVCQVCQGAVLLVPRY